MAARPPHIPSHSVRIKRELGDAHVYLTTGRHPDAFFPVDGSEPGAVAMPERTSVITELRDHPDLVWGACALPLIRPVALGSTFSPPEAAPGPLCVTGQQ